MKICLACEGISETAQPRCGHCGAALLPTDAVHYPERRGDADAGNPLLGTVVDGKYRLRAVLGRGGLGTVFQAVHIGSLMPVAVKLLHPRYSSRPEFRRALLAEARRAATIAHERCARLLDVGEVADGVAYLAMELVEGDTLAELLREGPLRPGHALAVLLQVAEALVAIHQAGLVHCDLSPRNVMVVARGGRLHTKVLDFGIARTAPMAGGEQRGGADLAGFANPAFAAPEQLAGQPVDQRADLHAFGALGWVLLTGSLPVADGESHQLARAVLAGERRPWPLVPGVPRRLVRLLQRCLQLDREQRPASAGAVWRELQAIDAARQPASWRAASVALLVAGVAHGLVAWSSAAPFLRPVAGSALLLRAAPPGPDAAVQQLPSSRLATWSVHFGGFALSQLHAELSRDGLLLRRILLRPETDTSGSIATLSTAQPEWREVLASLRDASREAALDLSLVVPGQLPLGSARLRIDDEAPQLEMALLPDDGLLRGESLLRWRASDDIAVASIAVEVVWADGMRWSTALPAAASEWPLGQKLASELGRVDDLGPGSITAVARDAAGNVGLAAPLAFRASDLQAPTVLELRGPAGESWLPVQGERARVRLRLSGAEAGCVLEWAEVAELRRPLLDAGELQWLELPAAPLRALAAAPLELRVIDAAGNVARSQHAIELRDRAVRLQFARVEQAAVMSGDELVLAPVRVQLPLQVESGEAMRPVRASLRPGKGAAAELPPPAAVQLLPGPAGPLLQFAALPAGSYELVLELSNDDSEQPFQQELAVPVRVLPPTIELRLPPASGRFLPDLLAAGVLQRNQQGCREGSGWRLPAGLRPYLVGTLWVGNEVLLPAPLLAGRDDAALLPDIPPLPGRNVFALSLRDVLDRPVAVLVGDRPAPRRLLGEEELQVVADFWWHEAAPELVGDEVLVEFGQQALLQLRLPLPFADGEREAIRLGLGQGEVVAQRLQPQGSGTLATFALQFPLWSVAAGLDSLVRSDYQTPRERRLNAYLATPVGRHEFELRLRTTRSTLRPLQLGELAELPPALASLRLLPVLAPETPFAPPWGSTAPPAELFRLPGPAAVRGIGDLLLQQREFSCGEAQALLPLLERSELRQQWQRYVHAADPLGARRLEPGHLLPAAARPAAPDCLLAGVDFFQAYSCCRLLGELVAGDPELFRLPLGVELELAAFAGAAQPAANGPAAAGRPLSGAALRAAVAAQAGGRPWTEQAAWASGDLVPGPDGQDFVGLDFGLREWVFDLPFLVGSELLHAEWTSDLEAHLLRSRQHARGEQPPPDLVAPLRDFAIVRGLAFGDALGWLGRDGSPLQLAGLAALPASVPGVVRSEQLRRDGRDLLLAAADRRLPMVGFRVAGGRELLDLLRRRR